MGPRSTGGSRRSVSPIGLRYEDTGPGEWRPNEPLWFLTMEVAGANITGPEVTVHRVYVGNAMTRVGSLFTVAIVVIVTMFAVSYVLRRRRRARTVRIEPEPWRRF